MHISQLPLHLGPLTVTTFSLIVAAAAVIGGAVTGWVARRNGENPVIVFDLLGWMLVLSVVFARLFYILNPPPSVAALLSRQWYLAHPLDLQIGPLAVWSGGLSMVGILVGAVLGALVVIRRRCLDGWLWADIAVPGLLLLLIIGPWGNLLAGQMIGPPTDLPWGVVIDNPSLGSTTLPYPPGTLFHPTPAYLSIWALLVGTGVWRLNKRFSGRLQKGDSVLIVSLFYAIGLFLADFLRVDVGRILLGLSGMQVVALMLFLWGAVTIARRHRRNGPGSPERIDGR